MYVHLRLIHVHVHTVYFCKFYATMNLCTCTCIYKPTCEFRTCTCTCTITSLLKALFVI